MTIHNLFVGNSNLMSNIKDNSVQLIVTSPPYPMIEMWDTIFNEQDNTILNALNEGKGNEAFEKMHVLLDSVWNECDRVLSNNGFICINIGDATRTIQDNFQLFSNHSRIINFFYSKGYSILPDIHWRKQSNAPNKFMGSGMYPAGAYVTYEHEYILIFRKGGKRVFKSTEKTLRQKSAYFWEERNVWFSDLWDIKGTTQVIKEAKLTRERSAAFPFEIPYRLINMYSAEGDTVLDPFAGLGTTNLASMASNRNSIGFDIDQEMVSLAKNRLINHADEINYLIELRIKNHIDFINNLPEDKREKCYLNNPHGFLVKTRQETAIKIDKIDYIETNGNIIKCSYK